MTLPADVFLPTVPSNVASYPSYLSSLTLSVQDIYRRIAREVNNESQNVDGGTPDSVYAPDQHIDGGLESL